MESHMNQETIKSRDNSGVNNPMNLLHTFLSISNKVSFVWVDNISISSSSTLSEIDSA